MCRQSQFLGCRCFYKCFLVGFSDCVGGGATPPADLPFRNITRINRESIQLVRQRRVLACRRDNQNTEYPQFWSLHLFSSMTRSSVCNGCRAQLKDRLRNRISLLQSQRCSYHTTLALARQITTPENSRSWYWDTTPPVSKDLASATTFFRTYLPRKLWTATEWRKQNEPIRGTLVPEVAFLGRSNVGKSSLLNALLLSPKLNHVGPRPGKTTTMHAWGLAASDPLTGGALRGHKGDTSIKIAVLDMPGYGHASHGDWGQEIITYLRRRKQLKRVFVLLDALHGVKDSDLRILDLLRKQAISHQVIASKCDRLGKGKIAQTALTEVLWKMRNAVQPMSRSGGFVGLGEILAVGALGDGRKNHDVTDGTMMGIEEVRYAVLKATGLESKTSLQFEAVVAEQTTYSRIDVLEAEGDELRPSTGTAMQTNTTVDATMDLTWPATLEPLVSSPPSRDRHRSFGPPPQPPNHPRKELIPIHKTEVTPVIDKVHKAIPDLSSRSAPDPASTHKPYSGTIGYGLRDLYEMTRNKPESDNKAKRDTTHLVLEGQAAGPHRRRSKLAKANARRQRLQQRVTS
jgi:GTP-binding protein